MVTFLLLAAATFLWPARTRSTAAVGRSPGDSPGSADRRDALNGAARAKSGGRLIRVPFLVAAAGAGVLAFVVSGWAGVIAAFAVLTTGAVLVRRALAERHARTALVEINAGLRMLGRELRAGAEPSVAATNAGAAASGAGAEVLRGLARLTRSDDRSAAGTRSVTDPRQPLTGSAFDGAAGQSIDGAVSASANDPRVQVAARLRSGWLLTRRHGLAFTPLIDALAVDLTEQIAAEAERAGHVAGPRMSGYVMAVLPLMGLALGVGMGANPFRILLLTPVGNILLLIGVFLTCAGLLWSARIVRR